jgi:hypothetical protein
VSGAGGLAAREKRFDFMALFVLESGWGRVESLFWPLKADVSGLRARGDWMKYIVRTAAAAAAAGIALAGAAHAGVIVDQSPDQLGAPGFINWSNDTGGQNFLVQFTLHGSATIDGMDIYTLAGLASVGDGVTVKIRADAGGAPAAANLYSFAETVSAIDGVGTTIDPGMVRLHADIAPTVLGAGTYWMGLSGDNTVGWNSVLAGPFAPIYQYQLSQDALQFQPHIGDLAWRIDGTGLGIRGVPEPASWAMMLLGLGALGGAMRARRRAPAKA